MKHLLDSNPLLERIRRAYHNSPMYAKLNGLKSAAEPAPAEPALGIPIDQLEQELADRANP